MTHANRAENNPIKSKQNAILQKLDRLRKLDILKPVMGDAGDNSEQNADQRRRLQCAVPSFITIRSYVNIPANAASPAGPA